eukprot:m.35474 g.35474  ORF g.35474 m.35474 type:complete len:145 (-) comp10930_c0_seq2:354-788(-)
MGNQPSDMGMAEAPSTPVKGKDVAHSAQASPTSSGMPVFGRGGRSRENMALNPPKQQRQQRGRRSQLAEDSLDAAESPVTQRVGPVNGFDRSEGGGSRFLFLVLLTQATARIAAATSCHRLFVTWFAPCRVLKDPPATHSFMMY